MHSENITNLVPTAVAGGEKMAEWSDERRADFVKTFEQRSAASRIVLELTAQVILDKASSRKFISAKHINQVEKSQTVCRYYDIEKQTGRTHEELYKVAQQQAEAVLKGLPPLKKAVQIIDPETATKIDKRDKLIAKGKVLRDKLVELAEPIKMAELDQSMSIGDFRKMVKDRERQQKRLIEDLKEVASEGNELENAINKALYSGLPGLSDAVVKAVNDCYQRSSALDAATRRVAEQVKFGDSAAAMSILRRFEEDEAVVSDEIKTEFQDALKKLKLAGAKKTKKTRKALPKKGK